MLNAAAELVPAAAVVADDTPSSGPATAAIAAAAIAADVAAGSDLVDDAALLRGRSLRLVADAAGELLVHPDTTRPANVALRFLRACLELQARERALEH